MSKYIEDSPCAFGAADRQGYPVWCSDCPYRDACDHSPFARREESK
ncbi:MAG: hypothetical protein IJ484_07890 [Oscillospiraceae bacterium]|nr:hypothetical protein [Oscillospiraceae bacterium]